MAEYIDKEKLRQAMFQEAFEKDSDLQRWDSGCWIRYKLFENVLEKTKAADVMTRDEGIRLGAELAAMHGSDATSQDLEKAYWRGFEDAMQKRDVQPVKWIPFSVRDLDEEEKAEHPEWDWILDGELPEDGQRILVNVKFRGHEAVQMDEYYDDDGCYLDSGYEIGTEVTHWMPLPEPYRKETENGNS